MARKVTGVAQRGATWTAYWPRPDGRQGSKGGFATQAAAKLYRSEQLVALARGSYVEPTKTTLAQWVAVWVPAIRSELATNTVANYEANLRNHVLPELGDIALSRLTKAHMRTVKAQMRGKLSTGSAQQAMIALHRCLKDAIAWGEVGLVVNVSDGEATDLKPKARPKTVWSQQHVHTFLSHCRREGARFTALYTLALATGMRRGELLGLRWDAHVFLDDDQPYLLVQDTIISVNGVRTVSVPKTEAGERMITLDSATVAMLRTHREVQQLERVLAGGAWRHTGLVFTQADGSANHPTTVSKMFGREVRQAGVPVLPFKQMRDTHATLGLKGGVPLKVMSKRLGHTSTAITADVYTHVLGEMDGDAATRIGALIYGPT